MNILPNYRKPDDPAILYNQVNISPGEHRRRYLETRITFEVPDPDEPYVGDRRRYWYRVGFRKSTPMGTTRRESFWIAWGYAPKERLTDKLQAWIDFCAGWQAGPPVVPAERVPCRNLAPTKYELRFVARCGRNVYSRHEREYCHLGDLPVGQKSLSGVMVVAQNGETTTLKWPDGETRQSPEARLVCKDQLVAPSSEIVFF